MAKAGVEQARHCHQGQRQYAEHDIVEDAVIRKIKPQAHGGPTGQGYAVISPVGLEGSHKIEEHLGKGQCDHDEVHPLGAQTDGANDQRETRTNHHGQWPGNPGTDDSRLHADGHGVRPQAHECGVAKTHHATEAKNQIQAACGECKDEDTTGQGQIKIGAGGTCNEWK